ncbi:hypothetical protein AJ78_01479 [Emergomyces pasteurianus Ep9510]|uniref:Uncharacterized protein n=1 Tax=Emergomyces pasteurianus Ep9510 TaxID=1447872 RepID=A0A1J9PRE9_9EURO|nr:hypothetical protein AJ78_01479 [Emergomyces pasteurianus Ep9510]
MQLAEFPPEILLHLGHALVVEWSVSYKNDVSGLNALAQTCSRFHKVFNTYLYSLNPRHQDSSALVWATIRGERRTAELSLIVRFLLQKNDTSTTSSHDTVVRLLIEWGTNIHARTTKSWPTSGNKSYNFPSWTPLRFAIHAYVAKNCQLARSCSITLVAVLVKAGANINAKGGEALTLLQNAALYYSTCRIFGADVNARGYQDATPLQYAMCKGKNGKILEEIERWSATLQALSISILGSIPPMRLQMNTFPPQHKSSSLESTR